MEPQLPSPARNPENGPAHFSGGEVFSGTPTPETAPQQPSQPERQESREQHIGGPQGDPVAAQPQAPGLPPLPTIAPATQQPAAPVVDDQNPATAADDDLIEKEWVEKAKKVILETKHDPYLQEQEVSKLQADYLKKRYGKTINASTDS